MFIKSSSLSSSSIILFIKQCVKPQLQVRQVIKETIHTIQEIIQTTCTYDVISHTITGVKIGCEQVMYVQQLVCYIFNKCHWTVISSSSSSSLSSSSSSWVLLHKIWRRQIYFESVRLRQPVRVHGQGSVVHSASAQLVVVCRLQLLRVAWRGCGEMLKVA